MKQEASWKSTDHGAEASDGWESLLDSDALNVPVPVVKTEPATANKERVVTSLGQTATLPDLPTHSSEGELPFDGAHLLELRGLRASVKTEDVEEWLGQLSGMRSDNHELPPPYVRWVDDTQAVAVYVDPPAARHALCRAASTGSSFCSLHPWSDASEAAQKLSAAQLQPPKPRPKATSAVARRLIGAALSMNLRDRKTDSELRDARRAKLEALEAEKARQTARQAALDEAWD